MPGFVKAHPFDCFWWWCFWCDFHIFIVNVDLPIYQRSHKAHNGGMMASTKVRSWPQFKPRITHHACSVGFHVILHNEWSVRHWLWGWGEVEGTVDFHEVCRGQFAVYEGEKHDCWQAFFLNPEIGPEVVAGWKTGRKTGSFQISGFQEKTWTLERLIRMAILKG